MGIKPSKLLQDKIETYVSIATYWTTNVSQIINMVILHFDISDEQAEQIVMEYLTKYKPQLLENTETKI